MDKLVDALKLVNEYENKDLKSVIREFEKYSNQKIPKALVAEWIFCGLSNLDILTCDF